MTSIKLRTGIFLAALAAVLSASAAVALGSARGSAPPSTEPGLAPSTSLDADAILPYILSHGDAHSLLAARRPHWLISWPETSPVRVHRDGIPVGGPDALRSVPLGSVQRIEWLNGNEASARFGESHAGGAILVTTR